MASNHRVIWASVALIFAIAGWGPNIALAIPALAVLAIGCILLWRPGEFPILLYIFSYQWLQASLAVFYSNCVGEKIESFSHVGGDPATATSLSLVGLLVLAFGIRLGIGAWNPANAMRAQSQAAGIEQRAILLFFLSVLLAATGAQALALILPGMSQPLLAFANLKWAAFVALTYITFCRARTGRIAWLIVFVGQFALSLGGYFSTFKEVFIYAFLGIVAAGVQVTWSRVISLATLCACALLLGVIWTAVKSDYRVFASQGAVAQVVSVDYNASISKLLDLSSRLDERKLEQGFTDMVRRITYIEFFGAAVTYVPKVLPHTDGALWLDAITRPIMPRVIFSDKTAIDESAHTLQYTGVPIAGADQATQISIGYVGDSYIDFGSFGMMVPMFILGAFMGWVYRWFTEQSRSRGLLGMGISSAVLMVSSDIGISAAKLCGALAVSFMVAWLLDRFVAKMLLDWLGLKNDAAVMLH